MGAAAAPVAAGFSIASAGLKVAGNMGEGQSKKTAAQLDALRLKTAAKAAEARAAETDAAYRDELNNTLANITAIRTAQNVSIDSPTARALYGEAEEESDRARRIKVGNERLKMMGLEADAGALLRGADKFTSAALLKSAADIASAGQSVAGMFGGGGSSSLGTVKAGPR